VYDDRVRESALHAADRLLEELVQAAPRLHAPSMTQITKVSYTHEAMIDLLIERPAISQNELAAHFGYSVPWVSHIFASDAFQVQLEKRREEILDPGLRATVKARFEALVARSIDILLQKLAQPVSAIPDQLALQAAALGARSLGLGVRTEPTPPPAGDRLQILAERLIVLQSNVRRDHGQIIEGELSQVIQHATRSEEVRRQEPGKDQSAEGAV